VLPLPTVNSCDFVLADAIERTGLAKGAIGPHGGLVWDNTEADCCSSQLQAYGDQVDRAGDQKRHGEIEAVQYATRSMVEDARRIT